jgi:hypothetical protein
MTVPLGEAVRGVADQGQVVRARSRCRFVLPLIYFTPDSLTYSVPLFLKRQCDRIPQVVHMERDAVWLGAGSVLRNAAGERVTNSSEESDGAAASLDGFPTATQVSLPYSVAFFFERVKWHAVGCNPRCTRRCSAGGRPGGTSTGGPSPRPCCGARSRPPFTRRTTRRERRRVGPEVGPTPAFSSCIPTGIHGPTCSFWVDLTAISLRPCGPLERS